MKKAISRLIYAAVLVATVFASIPVRPTMALGNTLLFSPSSQSMNVNDTVTVSVKAYVDVAAPNGSVAGTVFYPAGQLKVISTSNSGSTYGTPTLTPNSGSIGFNGSMNPGPSGLTQIFSVTLQAISGGTATLSFSGDSTINGASAARNTGTYTIAAPPPPPSGGGGSGGGSGTPKPTPAPVIPTPPPAPVATPPSNSDVADNTTEDATGVIQSPTVVARYNDATISWKHSKPQASSQLMYGASQTSLTAKAEVTPQADGSYSAKLVGLKPGMKYYYNITSTDAAKKQSTWDSLIITRGYPVVLGVTVGNQPAANAVFQISTITRTTGNDGTVTFELAEGKYDATITTADKNTKNVSFTVVSKTVPGDGGAPDSQKYTFNIDAATTSSSGGGLSILSFLLVLVGGGAVLVLGVLGYLTYRRRQYEGSYDDTYVASGPSVIIDDGYNWQQQSPSAPPPYSPPTPPPPPPQNTSYEEPKDMFELARERENRQL